MKALTWEEQCRTFFCQGFRGYKDNSSEAKYRRLLDRQDRLAKKGVVTFLAGVIKTSDQKLIKALTNHPACVRIK